MKGPLFSLPQYLNVASPVAVPLPVKDSSDFLILKPETLVSPLMFRVLPPASAAAAKSIQLCPTLCDPRDGSPPGSPIPGILQARILECAKELMLLNCGVGEDS